jgi:hypothetical protein
MFGCIENLMRTATSFDEELKAAVSGIGSFERSR